jgi:hypothetical protein
MTTVVFAEAAGDSGAVAADLSGGCETEDFGAAVGAAAETRARTAPEGRGAVINRDDAQPAVQYRKQWYKSCNFVLHACMSYSQEADILTRVPP